MYVYGMAKVVDSASNESSTVIASDVPALVSDLGVITFEAAQGWCTWVGGENTILWDSGYPRVAEDLSAALNSAKAL